MKKLITIKYLPVLLLAAVVLIVPAPAFAIDFFGNLLGNFLYFLMVYIPGLLLALVTRVLEAVVSYNGFADESSINLGWTVIRDVANMFFIVILLAISIGTILRSQRYGYQQHLRRLVIMAILINFSKTITLFFIEMSQAVTLYFVSTFQAQLQAGIPQLLGITGSLNIAENSAAPLALSGDFSNTILFRIALGGLMVIIATVVVIVITLIFVIRIVMFALIIVLSPLAFAASVLETTRPYYTKWWDMFGNYLVVGPAMAFFLWLSFTMVQQNTIVGYSTLSGGEVNQNSTLLTGTGQVLQNDKLGTISAGSTADIFSQFMFGIAMLLGSLIITKEFGVAGSGIAQSAAGKITGAGRTVARRGLSLAARPAGRVAELGVRGLDRAETGLRENVRGGAAIAGGLRTIGNITGYGRLATTGLRKAADTSRQARESRISAQADQVKNLSTEELQNSLASSSSAFGQQVKGRLGYNENDVAKIRELIKRGVYDYGSTEYTDENGNFNLDRQNADIDRATQVLQRVGGRSTEDDVEKLRKGRLSRVTDDVERRGMVREIVSAGEENKYLSNQPLTPEIIQDLRDLGVSTEDIGKIISKQSQDLKNQTTESMLALVDQYRDEGNEEEERRMRTLGMSTNGRQAHQFTQNISVNMRQQISQSLKGNDISKLSADAISDLAPYMSWQQVNAAQRAGLSQEQQRTLVNEMQNALGQAQNRGNVQDVERIRDTLTRMYNSEYFEGIREANTNRANANQAGQQTQGGSTGGTRGGPRNP